MRLSLCNEVVRELPFVQQCALAASLGYQALELSPFTLAPDPFTLERKDAREFLAIAKDHGLQISSLHWLLVKPDGLSLVSAEYAVRQRTMELLHRLVDFAAACEAQVLVHGSPKQRSPLPGQSDAEALAILQDSLASLAEHATQLGLIYCIEPLGPFETTIINTVGEGAKMVDAIGSPGLRTMFDLSAASHSETEPVDTVLANYLASGHIAHIQVNDRNRRGPGQGDTPVAPVLQVLKDSKYQGWIAVEPFEYLPNSVGCAAFCAGYLRGVWSALK